MAAVAQARDGPVEKLAEVFLHYHAAAKTAFLAS